MTKHVHLIMASRNAGATRAISEKHQQSTGFINVSSR
jgi:hypothetical protein